MMPSMMPRWIRRLAIVLVAVAATASVAIAFANDVVWPRSAWHQERYRAVATYVRKHSQPADRLYVWGNSPEIYLYAQRRMASRYMSANYQTGRVWGTPANEVGGRPDDERVPPESWTHLVADLVAHPPAYIVEAATGKLDKMDDERIERHPILRAFVARHYRIEATVLGVPIYGRK